MKKLVVALVLILIVALAGCDNKDDSNKEGTKTEKKSKVNTKKVFRTVGLTIAKNLSVFNASDEEFEIILKAMKEYRSGDKSKLDEFINKNRKDINVVVQERKKAMAEEEKVKGSAYLEDFKKKKGVQVTESGLAYKIESEGDGPKPTEKDKVKVEYRGKLIDGTEFDSSFKRGKPAVFRLSRLIPGWKEGLQLMNIGSKATLVIPSDIGYGDRGSRSIPPGATLVFEVKLIDINPPEEKQSKPNFKPKK